MKRREVFFAIAAFVAGVVCTILAPSLIRAMANAVLGGPATIWHEEARSPDGFWVAIGLTEQIGGPGTADCSTTVSLKRTNVSEGPMQVLGFTCGTVGGKAYTLDNVANAGGTIGLSMKWIDPSHLEVSYDARLAPGFYFQVLRTSGIEISVKDVSQTTTGIGVIRPGKPALR